MALTLAGLGGDENHTVGTTGTIDGGCRGILQHVNGGNVLWCNSCQVSLNTVNQDQRRQITNKCGNTTQTDGGFCRRTTAGVDHLKTCDLTFHEFCGIADLTHVEVLGLHRGNGRGDVALTLGTITDDDDFVQKCVVFLKDHVAASLHFLIDEADVADNEYGVAVGNVQRVVTFEVGNGSVLGAFLSHRGADNRLTLGVCDNTLHFHTLLSNLSNGW